MRVNLALQGGGAHGAFTWGVLDELLQIPNLEISGVSGTSAGAMNAAALKCGWAENGAQGARNKLRDYWEHVSSLSITTTAINSAIDGIAGPFAGIWKELFENSPITQSQINLHEYWSPYQNNPLDINPLRRIVKEHFPDELLQHRASPRLFINATNVRSGKIKVFKDEQMNCEALLASAALPTLFKAVEIEEEAYWDGGFTGNPALFPLIDHTDCDDILIVHINPLFRNEIPTTPAAIENRVNEISFNTSLLRELRQIDFIDRRFGTKDEGTHKFKKLRLHSIHDDKTMTELDVRSKLFASAQLIENLFEKGKIAAQKFLAENKQNIGKKGSLKLREMFE